eukprot:COSAG02_NODE_54875_length_293_cov_1.505155_1_plen_78_part_10
MNCNRIFSPTEETDPRVELQRSENQSYSISVMIGILMPPNIQRANSKSPCSVFVSAFYTSQGGGGGVLGDSEGQIGRS